MLSDERHYTLRQLSKRWEIDYHTLRRWFLEAPGVINASSGLRNCCRRIPESIAAREYERRMKRGRL